jgi:hypothetical protein
MNRTATEVGMRWGTLLAAAVVTLAPALAAQKKTDITMPLPETSRRMRNLEPPAGSEPASVQLDEVWQVGAPPEMLLSWYLRRLNWLSPNKDRVLDTSEVRMADTRPPMTYHITFHTYDDECRDSPPATSGSSGEAPPCKVMRLGKEKHRVLENNRVGFEQGAWIDRVTFMWMTRDVTGEVVRRTIELKDAGLSDDWKRYTLVTQITLKRELLTRPTQ